MNEKADLESLRQQVDEIDSLLVGLVEQRARIALEIGKAKTAKGMKVYDPSREGRVLDKWVARSDGTLPKGSIEEVATAVMDVCRRLQIDAD
ncbi:MAG TPA: chorismate mutase [Candidatus Saccharimonadales bacterium]|nr:chorismate mutase [Candidatus Saccharimonadales bacterium]